MTKTITAFDLETTGLDVQSDYILQLGLVKFNSDTFDILDKRCWYIKPAVDFKISPEAEQKTGITKEFILKNGVGLDTIWNEVVEFIGNDDMLSYNGIHFDIPMMYYNLLRYDFHFDFDSRKFYDSLVIERKRNSMKLENVYKRYTGKELDGAHNALNDIMGLIEIFRHQTKIEEGIEDPDFTIVSPEGLLKRNENGDLVFAIGKYRDCKTNDICIKDANYIKWISEKFSKTTLESIKREWYSVHPKKK